MFKKLVKAYEAGLGTERDVLEAFKLRSLKALGDDPRFSVIEKGLFTSVAALLAMLGVGILGLWMVWGFHNGDRETFEPSRELLK